MTSISEAVECLEELGYTVTAPVPPKPEVVLPTEPGVYLGSLFPNMPLYLTELGHWYTLKSRVVNPERHAPFTKLEPVPVTAKKVLEFIASSWEFGPPSNVSAVVWGAYREFGILS